MGFSLLRLQMYIDFHLISPLRCLTGNFFKLDLPSLQKKHHEIHTKGFSDPGREIFSFPKRLNAQNSWGFGLYQGLASPAQLK